MSWTRMRRSGVSRTHKVYERDGACVCVCLRASSQQSFPLCFWEGGGRAILLIQRSVSQKVTDVSGNLRCRLNPRQQWNTEQDRQTDRGCVKWISEAAATPPGHSQMFIWKENSKCDVSVCEIAKDGLETMGVKKNQCSSSLSTFKLERKCCWHQYNSSSESLSAAKSSSVHILYFWYTCLLSLY